MGRDSVIGIATRYGLDGPGNESRWAGGGGGLFPPPALSARGPTQPPVQWVPDLFAGSKRPGRGVDHPLPSSAQAEERVHPYFYSASGPSWPVTG